jgi:parallel beta-helix repeat protein
VHHAAAHALDFDAYTSNSVAYNNTCEDNTEEGIFVEETAHDNVVAANTCRRNGNGIAVYSNAVGPAANNFIVGNAVTDNNASGISSGGCVCFRAGHCRPYSNTRSAASPLQPR